MTVDSKMMMTGAVLRKSLFRGFVTAGALLVASSLMITGSSAADTKFAGRRLDFIVGFGPGGNNDTQARLLAPEVGKRLGVNVRVENQPAAGGLVALNDLYGRKGDVTRIGVFSGQGIIGSVLGGAPGVNFKLEDFSYMPQPAPDPRVLSSSKQSGLVTMQDVINAKDVKDATPGPGGSSYVDAVILYDVFAIKGEIVTGFKGASEAALALIRGNAQIRSATLRSTAPYVQDGSHNFVMVIGKDRLADYPNLPTVLEMNLNDQNKAIINSHVALGQMGLMIVAPPGLPADQIKLLQDTFQAVYDDPDMQAKYLKTTSEPITPYNTAATVTSLVNTLTNAPQQYRDLLHKAFDVR